MMFHVNIWTLVQWDRNIMPKVSVCLLRNACFYVWGTYNFMKKCRQTWKCGQKTEKQRRASAAQLGWDNVGNNSCGTLLGEYDDIITPVEHQHNCLYHTPPPYSPWIQGVQQNGVILYIHHTHHGYRVFKKYSVILYFGAFFIIYTFWGTPSVLDDWNISLQILIFIDCIN